MTQHVQISSTSNPQPYVVQEPGCLAYDFMREVVSPLGIQKPVCDHCVKSIERGESVAALELHVKPAADPDLRRLQLAETTCSLRESVMARVTT